MRYYDLYSVLYTFCKESFEENEWRWRGLGGLEIIPLAVSLFFNISLHTTKILIYHFLQDTKFFSLQSPSTYECSFFIFQSPVQYLSNSLLHPGTKEIPTTRRWMEVMVAHISTATPTVVVYSDLVVTAYRMPNFPVKLEIRMRQTSTSRRRMIDVACIRQPVDGEDCFGNGKNYFQGHFVWMQVPLEDAPVGQAIWH